MASSTTSVRPIERQLTKEYLWTGVVTGTHPLTIGEFSGAQRFQSVKPYLTGTGASATFVALKAELGADHTTATLTCLDAAGAVSGGNAPSAALVTCEIDENRAV